MRLNTTERLTIGGMIVLATITGFFAGNAWGDQKVSRTGGNDAPDAELARVPALISGSETGPAVLAAQMRERAWHEAVWAGWVADQWVAIDAEVDKIAAAEAARSASAAQPRTGSTPRPSQPSVSTGSCGGATNGADRYIQRESGGSPTARNPSGAFGCYQIMPGTWNASCSDLGVHGSAPANVQAQCASRLPLSAWGG